LRQQIDRFVARHDCAGLFRNQPTWISSTESQAAVLEEAVLESIHRDNQFQLLGGIYPSVFSSRAVTRHGRANPVRETLYLGLLKKTLVNSIYGDQNLLPMVRTMAI
jgi:hypothetical protein